MSPSQPHRGVSLFPWSGSAARAWWDVESREGTSRCTWVKCLGPTGVVTADTVLQEMEPLPHPTSPQTGRLGAWGRIRSPAGPRSLSAGFGVVWATQATRRGSTATPPRYLLAVCTSPGLLFNVTSWKKVVQLAVQDCGRVN